METGAASQRRLDLTVIPRRICAVVTAHDESRVQHMGRSETVINESEMLLWRVRRLLFVAPTKSCWAHGEQRWWVLSSYVKAAMKMSTRTATSARTLSIIGLHLT